MTDPGGTPDPDARSGDARTTSSGCSPASSTSPTTRSWPTTARRARRLEDRFNRPAPTTPTAPAHPRASCSARSATAPRSGRPSAATTATNLRIGARCFANFGLIALDVAPITIGDDVQIGPNVQLLTPTHPLEPELRRAKWEAAEPIAIGDNVWLGGGAIVLPGVTIGANTVSAPAPWSPEDLPPNVVAVGQPGPGDQDAVGPPRASGRGRRISANGSCSTDSGRALVERG